MIEIRTTVVKENGTLVDNMPVNVMTQEDAVTIDEVFKSTVSVLESNTTWMDLSDNTQTLLGDQIKILSKLIEDLDARVKALEIRNG